MDGSSGITYCLKESILILPFDNNSDNRFVLSCGTRHWNVSKKIKLIADIINVPKTFDEIWKELNKHANPFTKDEVLVILSDYFYANGWLENSECTTSAITTTTLWGRVTIVPNCVVKKFSVFKFLFKKPVILISLLFVIIINVFIVVNNGVDTNIIDKLNFKNIVYFILINTVVVIFHEIGHAVALMKYGYDPGRIGGAIYMWKPVMFTDVNSCWKLNRVQRQYVNFGGMYFQLILSTTIILIAYLSNFNNIVELVFYSYFSMLGNFNIFIKADGYWMFSDFLGVSNLHNYIINMILRREKVELSFFKKLILYIYSVLFVVVVVFMCNVMAKNMLTACTNVYQFINGGHIDVYTMIYSIAILLLICAFVFKMIKKIANLCTKSK